MLRPPDSYLGTFRERTTPVLRARVVDDSVPPVAIPGSALTAMTLTIFDERSGEIVNARAAEDIRAAVDDDGELTFPLDEEDTVMLAPTRQRERRRILLQWAWDTDKRGSWEMQFVIENVSKVGSPA